MANYQEMIPPMFAEGLAMMFGARETVSGHYIAYFDDGSKLNVVCNDPDIHEVVHHIQHIATMIDGSHLVALLDIHNQTGYFVEWADGDGPTLSGP